MWLADEKCFDGASHKTPVCMAEKIKTRQEGMGGRGWGGCLCAEPHVSELLQLKALVSDVT